jgi:exopolysaccharide biosynthesis polyprenyl glycosylphosphotransferase
MIHGGRTVTSSSGTRTIRRTVRVRAAQPPVISRHDLVVTPPVPADSRDMGHRRRRRLFAAPRGGRLESALVLAADLVLLAALCAVASSLTLTAVTAAGAVVTWRLRGLYTHRIALSVLDDVPELGIGVLVGLAPGAAAALVVPTGLVGAAGTLRVAASVLGVVILSRTLSYGLILRLRRQHRVSYPTVLIGAGRATRSIVRRIEDHPESGLRVVGTIGSQQTAGSAVPVLGGAADLPKVVRTRHISNIVVGYGGISAADVVEVLRTADRANLEIHVIPRLFELASRRGSDDHIWGLPLVRLRAPANRKLTWRAKRGFDILGAALALLLLAPLMASLALAVRISLGRGVIFTQTRIGLHGRPFEMRKFRSMSPSPTDRQGVWTVPEDELGRVGRFIRRYSLDELPQLFNVLRGDMSIVGPRPERPEYVEKFVALFPWYAHRHRVAAGMTGLAAVNGLRGDTSIEERCKFDNWYIDNWSLWLDTKILVRTLKAVVQGTGG